MRPDVAYVTVSKHACGIFGEAMCSTDGGVDLKTWWPQWRRVMMFSAGGYGHVPVPLLPMTGNAPPFPPTTERELDVFFVGRQNGPIRAPLAELARAMPGDRCFGGMVKGRKNKHCKGAGCIVTVCGNDIPDPTKIVDSYGAYMRSSKLSLAPRGSGRTSYRLSEILQSGRVPVYLYDDVEWLPYLGTDASPAAIGYSIRWNDTAALAAVLEEARAMSQEALQERERRALSFGKTHYQMDGVIEQIDRFFQGGGDLRCTQLPSEPN